MPCRSSKVCFEKLLILNVLFLAPFPASAEPGQAWLCSRLIEKVRFFICSSEWNCSGPQPPGSGGPQFVPELGVHSAVCGPHGPDGPIRTQGKPAAERTGGIDCKELQPSARGRLRAVVAFARLPFKMKKKWKMIFSGSSLRSTRRSGPAGRELRAFAGRSCGPHGLFKAEIQNSRF